MSALTGQYISQSYGGVIHLSTNTGIVAGTYTSLEDGFGNSLGWSVKTGGILSGSQITASLFGTASYAANATNWTTQSVDIMVGGGTPGQVSVGTGNNSGENTAVGYKALNNQTSSTYTPGGGTFYKYNTVIGYEAAASGSTNLNIVAIGHRALLNNGTTLLGGQYNHAIGVESQLTMSLGEYNTSFGWNSLKSSQGSSNTAIGFQALSTMTGSGEGNTAVGRGAMHGGFLSSYNTAVGIEAGNSNNSIANTYLGAYAGRNGVSGSYQIAIGVESLYHFSTGSENVSIGHRSQFENRLGWRNITLGNYSLNQNYYANDNIAIGHFAGYDLYQGSGRNIFIGQNAGRNITSGSGNVIIGNVSSSLSAGLTNNIILADGQGNIRLRYSGSWNFAGGLTITGSITNEVTALSVASNTASMDLSTGAMFTLTLISGSNVFLNPTNIKKGSTAILQVSQPAATGSGTLTWAGSISFPSGSAYTASINLGAADTITFASFDGTKLRAVATNNFV